MKDELDIARLSSNLVNRATNVILALLVTHFRKFGSMFASYFLHNAVLGISENNNHI